MRHDPEIPLDLHRHCVETEIRRLHNRALRTALAPGGLSPALEARLQLLQQALETFDFPRLRSLDPILAGGCAGGAATLGRGPAGLPALRIAGRETMS